MSSFYKKIRPTIIKLFYVFPLTFVGNVISLISIGILWIISPVVKVKVAGLIAQRLGHLTMNTDLFFRHRQLFGTPSNTRYIFLAGTVANRQLFTMWKRHMIIIESRLLRGLFNYSESLWKKTRFYEDIEIRCNEYQEYQTTHPTLSFTREEEERGREGLKKMGINPDKDWFVCISARDPAYMTKMFSNRAFGKKDWSYHDDRNSDINTYNLAIDYLVGRGGFVIRMGYHVSQPLNYEHPHVIDYACKCRSDFMDIYLAAKCRFFVGTGNGICDVTMAFDTPRIVVNAAPPITAPIVKKSLFIPKKIRVRKTGQYLPYGKFFADTVDPFTFILSYAKAFRDAGYKYENDTPEEIRDVVIEMVERLEGTFEQTEEDRVLLANYFNLFPIDHWMAPVKTPMGRNFLRNNRDLFSNQTTEFCQQIAS